MNVHPADWARPRRLVLIGLTLVTVLVGCGLEERSGAVRGVEVPATAAEVPDDQVRPGVVSVDPTWQELQLGPHVSAWLPVNQGWQLVGQGTNARGGSYVQLTHPDSSVSVRAETWPGGDQSAAALCATTLVDLLADSGVTGITPEPIGNRVPDSQLVDAFSCRVTSVRGPGGPSDHLLDVLVRETDQITYTQLVTQPSESSDPASMQAALGRTEEMLARTLGRLEQR